MPHALSTRFASLASNENDRLTRATSLTARSKKGGFAMGNFVRPLIGLLLSELLILLPVAPSAQAPASQPKPQTRPRTLADDTCRTLHCYLSKSYLDLFELSPHLEFSASEYAAEKQALEEGRKSCVGTFTARAKEYGQQLDSQQKQLELGNAKANDDESHNLHCDIQKLPAKK